MSNLLQISSRKSKVNAQSPRILHLFSSEVSSFLNKFVGNPSHSHHIVSPSSWFWVGSRCRHFSHFVPQEDILISRSSFVENIIPLFGSNSFRNTNSSYRSHQGLVFASQIRLWGSQAASEQSTSDGLTVDGILANNWTILDENEGNWKSHATAIAQSIHLIKRRLQWRKLMVRLDILSAELNKLDLWDDPVHASKISREHGALIGKMKEVNALEQELLENIDMIKLAREENDEDLESVGTCFCS